MSVSDLRLGMTLDETQKILGEDYQDGGYYDEEINQFILTRTYEDGIQLFFNPIRLNRIYVTGEKYITELGVNVGMPITEAVGLYDSKFNRLKSHKSLGEGEVDSWIGTYVNDEENEVIEFRYGDCKYLDSELTESMIIEVIIMAKYHPYYFYL